MENKVIRTCPTCLTPITILDIACNPTLQPAGMDSYDGSESNLGYTFVHTPCGSSMVIRVDELRDLLPSLAAESTDSSCGCLEQWTYDADRQQNCDSSCKYEPYRKFMAGITQIKMLAETNRVRPETAPSGDTVDDAVTSGEKS